MLPVGIILLGGLLMFVLMSGKKPPEKKPEVKKDLLVETFLAESRPHTFTVISQGTVQPKIQANIVTEVSGKIIQISEHFVNGGLYKKGDLLLQIDPADYKTALALAEANLAKSQASLEEEKARSAVAESEWKSYMQGQAPDLYLRKPQLAREIANVKSAKAEVERAKRNLQKTRIVADFDGLIKTKRVDLGQFVTTGTPLALVYGTELAEIRLPISDTEIDFLAFNSAFELEKYQPQVTFMSEIGNNKARNSQKLWQGKIVRTEGTVDEQSRMLYLVAQVEDPYGLKLDMADKVPMEYGRFVKGRIQGQTLENIVTIPRDLVINDNQLLLVENNKVKYAAVEVTQYDVNYAYIGKGIIDNDAIIKTKIKLPLPGTPVRLISTKQASQPIDTDSIDKKTETENKQIKVEPLDSQANSQKGNS